jgi:hypothetical protein
LRCRSFWSTSLEQVFNLGVYDFNRPARVSLSEMSVDVDFPSAVDTCGFVGAREAVCGSAGLRGLASFAEEG